MKIEQIYTGCLAQGAYYIESNGEAAIIDPLRETHPYLERAKTNGAVIKYILETHFHADFVSGHVDLAQKTGATIVYGPTAKTDYPVHVAHDGEVLKLGNIQIKVLHTPGHTPESTTYLLLDEQGREHCIFSGDTLFIGDVGRPDLAVKSDLTQQDLAGMLFDSLRNKIMPLPDHVIVFPAHGAGSACGKNMSKETEDTLGNQKKLNYALRADMTRSEFIAEVTEGLMPPPQYFSKNAMMNKQGYESFDAVMERGAVALDPAAFKAVAAEHEALVLDTRKPADYASSHVPGSIFIGIDGQFAPWVGTLITDIKQPIVLVTDAGREEEVVMRLSRVGYDNALGYLNGGIDAWKAAGFETDRLDSISAEEFANRYTANELSVVDVRKPSEYDPAHVKGAVNLPLDSINEQMQQYHPEGQYYLHCQGGYRSVIAASILKARGIHGLVNVEGGYKAISGTALPIVHSVPA
jgi:glyoxylase-like metal-dependent hydrolase (beta-lactamase superfamily II)/rhodanese-related sulfurtransferase